MTHIFILANKCERNLTTFSSEVMRYQGVLDDQDMEWNGHPI